VNLANLFLKPSDKMMLDNFAQRCTILRNHKRMCRRINHTFSVPDIQDFSKKGSIFGSF